MAADKLNLTDTATLPLPAATHWPVILCIDDDPEISRSIELRLRPYRVQVLRAFHGMHGFWLAMTEHPDVIITDINMPQGQGDYIVECLKRNAETSDIPVYVLSGRRDESLKKRMRQLGVEDYLTKPCDADALLAAIEQFVELEEVEFDEVTG
ncbi:MAG: response regulator [Planctomycetales bacterium]|nr:response regulator [Planctomycetales bacterium]